MKRIAFCMALMLFASRVLLGQGTRPVEPTRTAASRSQIENDLIRLEHEWHTSLEKNDVAKLDRLLAKGWIITNGSGVIITKSAVLSDLRSGDTKFISTVPSEIKVHVYRNVAVVTKISTDQTRYGTNPGGGRYQMTDVFANLDGRWQCVATHSSHDLNH